jgi:hypothetical protein
MLLKVGRALGVWLWLLERLKGGTERLREAPGATAGSLASLRRMAQLHPWQVQNWKRSPPNRELGRATGWGLPVPVQFGGARSTGTKVERTRPA